MQDLEKIVIDHGDLPIKNSVIWLHGLGADGNDFTPIVAELNLPERLSTRFVFPHAPVQAVTINAGMSMRAWYDIVSLTDLDNEDLAGIVRSQKLVENLIAHEMDAGIQPENIILAGFSQGGAMALYSGLRYPKTLGGIMALSAYLPLGASLKAEANTANQKTPIFIAHGEYDDVLPIMLGTMTRDFLLEHGYDVAWNEYAMGHQVHSKEIGDISAWLQTRLS